MFDYGYGYMPQMRQPMYSGINGRVISRVDDIMVSEVPTNGDCGVFPTSDYSTIYLKKWNPNGTISTITYKPQIEQKPIDTINVSSDNEKSLYGEITKRLEGIESNLLKLMEGRYEHTANNISNDAETK